MPSRTIPVLASVAVILFVAYVSLVVATISFAAWQSQSASMIGEREERIADLEALYFEEVKRVTSADPSAYGLARPVAVRYVTAAPTAAVSFAGR